MVRIRVRVKIGIRTTLREVEITTTFTLRCSNELKRLSISSGSATAKLKMVATCMRTSLACFSPNARDAFANCRYSGSASVPSSHRHR